MRPRRALESLPAQPVTAHGVQDLTIKAVFRDIPEVYLQI
jgi:hypothetical protein